LLLNLLKKRGCETVSSSRSFIWLPLQDSTKPPVAATIFFGANDAALLGRTLERLHVPVEEYKENLRKIVHHLKVQVLFL
jgi:lysophospholipase L1-like esterase